MPPALPLILPRISRCACAAMVSNKKNIIAEKRKSILIDILWFLMFNTLYLPYQFFKYMSKFWFSFFCRLQHFFVGNFIFIIPNAKVSNYAHSKALHAHVYCSNNL